MIPVCMLVNWQGCRACTYSFSRNPVHVKRPVTQGGLRTHGSYLRGRRHTLSVLPLVNRSLPTRDFFGAGCTHPTKASSVEREDGLHLPHKLVELKPGLSGLPRNLCPLNSLFMEPPAGVGWQAGSLRLILYA